MRKHGRPLDGRRFRSRPRGRASARMGAWGTDNGCEHVLVMCKRGWLAYTWHVWTGRVLKQALYPFELWKSLSREARERSVMSFFNKPSGGVPGKQAQGGKVEDPKSRKEAPTLLCYLEEAAWPDGELREPSTLIVFVEEGSFKACLSEKNTLKSLWATSKTFWGLLEALESRLTADTLDWRAQRPKGKKG